MTGIVEGGKIIKKKSRYVMLLFQLDFIKSLTTVLDETPLVGRNCPDIIGRCQIKIV